jgi:predicted lipoprotein with Yx(FWY)xxD motif
MRHAHGRARGFGPLVVGLWAVGAVLLAACGSKTTPTGSGGGSSPGTAGELGARSIAGIGSVLHAPSGLTLYHLETEAKGKIDCTGGCASTWPPLLASSGKVPAASPDVAGRLGTIERPDGALQVTFEGMALYTYAGDSAPGQANGQGIGGVWFAVTTSAGRSGSSPGGYPGY